MEKITSLQKEKKIKRTNSFTKLKINHTESTDKIIEKIIKYLYSDLKKNNVDLSKFSEYLNFKHFKLGSVIELPEYESNALKGSFCSNKDGFCQGYEISILDKNNVDLTVLTNVRDISKKALKSAYWRMNHSKVYTNFLRICDAKYIYGIFKLLDITYEYCITQKDEILSNNFSEISLYGNCYSEEDINSLININHIKGISTLFRMSKKKKQLIVDLVASKQLSDFNIELMDQYERDVQHQVARAFETKKNIPDKIQSVMKNNDFLNYFSYVELDAETDLKRFSVVEKEWLYISNLFNLELLNVQPELRFRKLGKHRALGLYFPGLKCLCVDITSPSSFIHEFGHHIDYTYSEKPLSLQAEFRNIIRLYTKFYDLQREDNKSLKNKRNYYLTPTEIFARTFELYLVNKNVETSFLKDKKNMIINDGYPDFNKNALNKINAYFDSFNFNFMALKKESIKEEIKETVNLVMEEIKYKNLKQVCFF
ncbi:LPD1 domain-containing protein [Clostridium butyricum]|uniref:LPD1 domain-containing protein n=1 Tax=Clostridium butyricum TaxID=1492 RepID=UPI002AB1F819|nr:LPD1 domain-containing protein [Clostridium butyricum]